MSVKYVQEGIGKAVNQNLKNFSKSNVKFSNVSRFQDSNCYCSFSYAIKIDRDVSFKCV